MFILYIALFRHFIWKDGEVSADKHLPSHTNGLTQALTKICSLLGKILPQQDLCVCVFATAQVKNHSFINQILAGEMIVTMTEKLLNLSPIYS